MTNKFSKNLSLGQTAVAFSLMLSKLCMMLSFNFIQFSLQHQMLRTIFQQGKVVDGSGIQALSRKILNHTKQIYHFTSMDFPTSKPCQTNYAILLEENMKQKTHCSFFWH
jgi:uncharacterized SAM-binding protein YcdF (DUF218 family)